MSIFQEKIKNKFIISPKYLFCKSEFKILYSEIVFTQNKKVGGGGDLGLKNKDIVKVNQKKRSFPFLLLKYEFTNKKIKASTAMNESQRY